MIKYVPEDTSVCFSEIKSEISLGINLSCCIHKCPGCHSPYLQTDCGEELTIEVIDSLLERHKGITCVLFLGGDNDKDTLKKFADYISSKGLMVGWYSGETYLDLNDYGKHFNYIKVGPYIKELGPLNNPLTNQRLYYIVHKNDSISVEDITYTLQKKP